jgi:hypothetical protein
MKSCYGDDLESLFQTIIEFREVLAEELAFNDEEEKFKQFRKCLKNTAQEEWDLTKDPFLDVGNGFILAQQVWLRRYLSEVLFEVQKNYLAEQLRKPYNMDTHAFVQHRLQYLNAMLKEFPKPNGVEPLLEHQVKNIFFRAMPEKWQRGFILGGNHVNQLFPMAQLIRYMETGKRSIDKQREHGGGCGGRFGRGKQGGRGGHGGRGGTRTPKAVIKNVATTKVTNVKTQYMMNVVFMVRNQLMLGTNVPAILMVPITTSIRYSWFWWQRWSRSRS